MSDDSVEAVSSVVCSLLFYSPPDALEAAFGIRPLATRRGGGRGGVGSLDLRSLENGAVGGGAVGGMSRSSSTSSAVSSSSSSSMSSAASSDDFADRCVRRPRYVIIQCVAKLICTLVYTAYALRTLCTLRVFTEN